MLQRMVLGLLVAGILVVSPLHAGEEMLTAAEIESLLSGNTASGDWGGAYKQYFDVNGSTLYVPSGGASDTGKWRVNAEKNTYESWWSSTGWTTYSIARDGDALMWVDAEGNKYAFKVHQGNQLK